MEKSTLNKKRPYPGLNGNDKPSVRSKYTAKPLNKRKKPRVKKDDRTRKTQRKDEDSSEVLAGTKGGILRKNSFDALSLLSDQEIVLVDSDEEEANVESDGSLSSGNVKDNENDKPNNEEGIKGNADFIGFDFSDSDSEEKTLMGQNESDDEDNEHFSKGQYEYDNYDSDNNYLSNDDENSTYRQKPRSKYNSEYPWLQNHDHSSKMEIVDWLNLEIKDFVNYISPSKEEISIRNEVYKKIKYMIVTQLWNDCEVQVFGSFATDLYLPGSDIDMVITSKEQKYDTRAHLYQLSAFLRKTGLGINVETIAKARVPIIKFVEPDSKIHIDISFERLNGLTALRNIRQWLDTTPGLRELVLIVKQFLAVRKLNNVHVGGLGGYSIICLVYSFLKCHPRLLTNSIDPHENLGILLIEFFELYGLNFGYDDVAILFDKDTKEAMYVPKRFYPDLMTRNSFSILIRDPNDPTNNLSRGSFNIRDIKRSFGGAFQLLVNRCYELNELSYKSRLNQSILGGVIKYKGKERDFEDARNDVANEAMLEYDALLQGLPPLPSQARKLKEGNDKDEQAIIKNKVKRLKQAQARRLQRNSVSQNEDESGNDSDRLTKILKSQNDIHYYSDYSSSDDEDSKLLQIVEDSKDTTKKIKASDKEKLVSLLFGIKSDSEKEETVENVHGSDSDSEEESSEKKQQSKVEKSKKRDYWTQKGGL